MKKTVLSALSLALILGTTAAVAAPRDSADALFCFKMPKYLGGDWTIVQGTFKIEDLQGDPLRSEVLGLKILGGKLFKDARVQDLPSESIKGRGHPSSRWVRIHLAESIFTKDAGVIETINFVFSRGILGGGRDFNQLIAERTKVHPNRPRLIATSDHVRGADGTVRVVDVEAEKCPAPGPRWRR